MDVISWERRLRNDQSIQTFKRKTGASRNGIRHQHTLRSTLSTITASPLISQPKRILKNIDTKSFRSKKQLSHNAFDIKIQLNYIFFSLLRMTNNKVCFQFNMTTFFFWLFFA